MSSTNLSSRGHLIKFNETKKNIETFKIPNEFSWSIDKKNGDLSLVKTETKTDRTEVRNLAWKTYTNEIDMRKKDLVVISKDLHKATSDLSDPNVFEESKCEELMNNVTYLAGIKRGHKRKIQEMEDNTIKKINFTETKTKFKIYIPKFEMTKISQFGNSSFMWCPFLSDKNNLNNINNLDNIQTQVSTSISKKKEDIHILRRFTTITKEWDIDKNRDQSNMSKLCTYQGLAFWKNNMLISTSQDVMNVCMDTWEMTLLDVPKCYYGGLLTFSPFLIISDTENDSLIKYSMKKKKKHPFGLLGNINAPDNITSMRNNKTVVCLCILDSPTIFIIDSPKSKIIKQLELPSEFMYFGGICRWNETKIILTTNKGILMFDIIKHKHSLIQKVDCCGKVLLYSFGCIIYQNSRKQLVFLPTKNSKLESWTVDIFRDNNNVRTSDIKDAHVSQEKLFVLCSNKIVIIE